VIYDIRHLTLYKYGSTVTFSHCALRLLPADGPGQTVLSSGLRITPEPAQTLERRCFFGNRLSIVTVETAHRELAVEVTVTVEIDRNGPEGLFQSQAFEDVREEAFGSASLDKESPVHFLYPSRLVPHVVPITDYVRTSFPDKQPVLNGAKDLMRRINADFKYDTKATVVSTPVSEAFSKRRGVCQDFAHIMIAGLRGLGLPAAYISGYVRTIPPPGKKRLEGADATHAWVSVWCGRPHGWVGFDPTNAAMIGNDHIAMAKGRDYADVSPVAGIVLGSGEQDVEVQVDVVPRV
jgi:transglutaminase-like putative cysteine protease